MGRRYLSASWRSRIVADFEALDAVRLQFMVSPDAAHAGIGVAHRPRRGAARPTAWRWPERSAWSFSPPRPPVFRRDGGFAPGPWSRPQQSGHTQFWKPDTPAGRHARGDLQLPGDLHVLHASPASRTMRHVPPPALKLSTAAPLSRLPTRVATAQLRSTA